MQRRDQIVVAVLALVVDRRAPLHDPLQPFRVEHLAGLCRAPDFFGQRQRRAAVAIGHAQEHRPRLLVERQRRAFGLLGARQQLLEALLAERVEDQHAGAGQKRGVELEGRILGGRADEDDRAVLHDRQKAVLLGAVEAMDLVDEEQRLAAVLSGAAAPPRTPSSGRRRPKRSPISARRRGLVSPASSRATVVLPVPGGPQKIIEPSEPERISRVSAPSSPVRCSWPTTSARFFGRSRSASGAAVRALTGSSAPKRSAIRYLSVCRSSLPSRSTVKRHQRAGASATCFSFSAVSISSPFTSRTMSRGWKPKRAAGELPSMSTTVTPLMSASRPRRCASRGDRSAILAPANGLRPRIVTSAALAPSGARISSTPTRLFVALGEHLELGRGADRLRRQPVAQRVDMLDAGAVHRKHDVARLEARLRRRTVRGHRGDQRAGRPRHAERFGDLRRHFLEVRAEIGPLEVVAAAGGRLASPRAPCSTGWRSRCRSSRRCG